MKRQEMTNSSVRLTILIVSSDERLGRILQREINSHGHIAIMAVNGEEALAMAGASFQDIILLDSALSGESAIEIARNLLCIRSVAILMLAGATEEITRARAEGVEVRGYLLKPFAAPHLWSGIREVLATHRNSHGGPALIADAYDKCDFDEALWNAAQIAMHWMECSPATAYEKVAELAGAHAQTLRKESEAAA